MRSMTAWLRTLSALLLIPAAVTFAQPQPTPLTDRELHRLPGAVQGWREMVMSPGARWNWCRVPSMFGDDGVVRGSDYVERASIARTTKQCAARDSAARAGASDRPPYGQLYVEVFAVRIYDDSVVVRTWAQRSGVSVTEEYVLIRRPRFGTVLAVALMRLSTVVIDD